MVDKTEIAVGIVVGCLLTGGGYLLFRPSRHSPPVPAAGDVTGKALAALIGSLALNPAGKGEAGKIDRHKTFFLYRRLRDLSADPAAGQGLESLKARVELELKQVDAFLTEKLGTPAARGPYYGGPRGTEAPEAAHLDLGTVLRQRRDDPPATTEAAATTTTPDAPTLRELDGRRSRVIGIAWRAAAIDNDVWTGTGTSSTLRKPVLTELLDRRLHSVERLQYQASAGATPNGIGSSFIDRVWGPGNRNESTVSTGTGTGTGTGTSPPTTIPPIWHDDYLVRMFEAPSIPRTASDATGWEVEDSFTKSGILVTDPGTPRYNLTGANPVPEWYLNLTTGELDFNKWPGTQFAAVRQFDPLERDVAAGWDLVSDLGAKRGYGWVAKKAHDRDLAADIIHSLFMPGLDWWQRTWMHADGVMSALHLEALRLGKRRLKDDTLFNALPDRAALALDDYFQVRPRIASAENGIMQFGRTLHFENASIPLDDLQIGDQVLFDTSPVLFALGETMWDYPTALVTELDTSADSQALDKAKLKLQGFDTADLDYPSFQVVLANAVDRALDGVRGFITSELSRLKAAAPAGTTFTPPSQLKWDPGLKTHDEIAVNDVAILRQWNPYGDTWDDPGPWWIWINLLAESWAGVTANDISTNLRRAPGGIVWTPDNEEMLFEMRGQVDPSTTIRIGTGFRPPPWQSASVQADPRQTIFVPLYEPFGGWVDYLIDKAAHPDAKLGSHLDPVRSDARWLPGIFTQVSQKVRAIRPRLEPASSSP